MGTKPKTRDASPKQSEAEKQKEQSARFIEAARELGVDESGKAFAKAIEKITERKRS